MLRKFTLIILLGLLIIPINSFSQRRKIYKQPEHEVNVGIGSNKFFGDIGGYVGEKSLFSSTHPSFSVGYKYTIPVEVAFGFGIDRNNFSGSENSTHNGKRGLSFKSAVWGINTQIEYIVFGGPYDYRDTKHTVSVFAGTGVAFANSTITRMDELRAYAGNPPADEFDAVYKFKYSETAPTAHAGVSYKYRFSYNWSVGIKYRITQYFSDYIDGFHPITSRRDDAFQDIRLSVGYYINTHSYRRK